MIPGLRARLVAKVGALSLDVDLDTGPGSLVLVGPNGAGKSSLLALILGALPARLGRVSVGEDVLLDTERGVDVPVEARRLGYVPQDHVLFPRLDVRGNVTFGLGASLRGPARSRRVDELCAAVGVQDLAARRTHDLSGGERQRVAIARALAIEPRALLLDEPLAALDPGARGEMRVFLRDTLVRLRLPAVVVTHDAADARLLGQRVAVLEGGRITQVGTFDDLARRPASRFVEGLVASPS